jgi:hypothetical protein
MIIYVMTDAEPLIPLVKRSYIAYSNMRDPELLSRYYRMKSIEIRKGLEIAGDSPTDIFIGRFGYPYVSIGPLVPPIFGDTSMLSTPEMWRSSSIEQVLGMRNSLVRGMYKTKVQNVEGGKVEEMVRDLALASKPTGAQLSFAGKGIAKEKPNDETEPFGPSAWLKGFELGNVSADRKVERAYSDTDAKAADMAFELYDSGIPVSKIQKVFSAGLLGMQKNRKFVPTRWSITAVDDTLSKKNLEEVKQCESIDTIMAYYSVALDNRWLIFFFPGSWEYESIEAFYPGAVWNEKGTSISIGGSYEPYTGRKTYAEMGGCFYSGRLAITERLKSMQKQASALILREVHEGYTMPVGVWNVREHVRETLETEPMFLHGIDDVFAMMRQKLEIGKEDWVKSSRMLRQLTSQRRLFDYVRERSQIATATPIS